MLQEVTKKLFGKKWILVGLGITSVLAITGVFVWFVYPTYFGPAGGDGEEPAKEEELDCDTILLKEDWQTYTETDGFGYTIRYPADWQVSEELFSGHSYWRAGFGPEGNISETAAVFIGEANYHTLENYRHLLSDGTSPPYILGESEDVIVDGENATRFFLELEGLEQYKYVLYYVPYEQIGVNRLFQGNTEESIRRDYCESDVFYTMIGSYEFGQEYEKEDCGFSFRYPLGWEIESDYYYETAGGSVATLPTIHLREVDDEETNEWITIYPRQSDCYYVESPEIEEEYINGSTVTSYYNETQGARCIEADVSVKDKNGKSTSFEWISMSSSEETQEIFKQIVYTFEVY